MDLRATPNLVHLTTAGSGRRSLRLEPASGYRVVAVSGEIWLTQHGHTQDYVLRSGEELTLDSPGAAIVSSFGPADIEVIAASTLSEPPLVTDAEIERAQRRAHALRAQAMQAMFRTAGAWLRARGRQLVSRIGGRRGAPGAAAQ